MRQQRPSAVSARSILLGLALIPVNCYWLVITRQPYQYQAIPTIISPFFNVIFILFVVVLLNRILIRLSPGAALTQGEMITVYIMLSLTSAIQSFQMMQTLVPMMENSYTAATPENDWENLFARYIPSWLSVNDKSVLQPYYEGESTLYTANRIKAWLMPSLWWSAFVVMLVLVMGYIAVFFRRSWVEHEKLSYPTIQLPLEMTNTEVFILKNKLLWIGFAISGGLALVNGLGSLLPNLPTLRIHPYHNNLGRYITSKPWDAIGILPIGVIFPVVGLAFFMPLDMSFSCFAFYGFAKMQRVATSAFGLRSIANSTYLVDLNQQSFGALAGIAVMALWVNRKYLFRILRGQAREQSHEEPLSYRGSGLGVILGIGFMVLFLWRGGMAIWVGGAFFLLYYISSLGLTRIRAEMGVPLHDFHFVGPDQMLPDVLGSRRIGYRSLTMVSMLGFFNFTYRAHPQPHQMEGFALFNRARASSKRIFLAMALALIVGTISLFWIYLHVAYTSGGSSLQRFAHNLYSRLANRIAYPSGEVDMVAVRSIGGGFIAVILLTVMQKRFMWWRLYPAAYAISNSRDINFLWFSIMISFAVKWALLKYGGIRKYRQARPLFLGLILGAYIVGSIWTIIGVIVHKRIFFGGMT